MQLRMQMVMRPQRTLRSYLNSRQNAKAISVQNKTGDVGHTLANVKLGSCQFTTSLHRLDVEADLDILATDDDRHDPQTNRLCVGRRLKHHRQR